MLKSVGPCLSLSFGQSVSISMCRLARLSIRDMHAEYEMLYGIMHVIYAVIVLSHCFLSWSRLVHCLVCWSVSPRIGWSACPSVTCMMWWLCDAVWCYAWHRYSWQLHYYHTAFWAEVDRSVGSADLWSSVRPSVIQSLSLYTFTLNQWTYFSGEGWHPHISFRHIRWLWFSGVDCYIC